MKEIDLTIPIEVTQEDLDLGSPGRPRSCPVARAACRAYGLGDYSVGVTDGVLNLGIAIPAARLPADVHRKIIEIDAYRPVEPFTFTPLPLEKANG